MTTARKYGYYAQQGMQMPGQPSQADNGTEQNIVNQYLSRMFQFRTQLHVWHFQTDSLNVHKGLNGLYDEILDLTDSFIESYQGINGSRISGIKGMPYQDLSDISMILSHIEETMVFITQFQQTLQESELINMLDEQKSTLSKYAYLLSLQ